MADSLRESTRSRSEPPTAQHAMQNQVDALIVGAGPGRELGGLGGEGQSDPGEKGHDRGRDHELDEGEAGDSRASGRIGTASCG